MDCVHPCEGPQILSFLSRPVTLPGGNCGFTCLAPHEIVSSLRSRNMSSLRKFFLLKQARFCHVILPNLVCPGSGFHHQPRITLGLDRSYFIFFLEVKSVGEAHGGVQSVIPDCGRELRIPMGRKRGSTCENYHCPEKEEEN